MANFLKTGLGILLKGLGAVGDIAAADKSRKLSKEAMFMQSKSHLDAADMSERMGIWAKDIADNNAAAQFTYAENLLKTGKINMDYMSAEVVANKLRLAKAGSELMNKAAVRSVAAGIELSGSPLDQLTSIQDQMMDQTTQIDFNGNMASIVSLVQSHQQASQARILGRVEQTRGLMEQAQYNYHKMSQQVDSLGVITSAKLQSNAESFALVTRGLSAGTSLLGKAYKFANIFGD